MKACRVKITGKVQGVAYRANAAKTAAQLGIKGWVKNNEDGSVEMEISGDESKIEAMLRWCSKGPALARVDKLDIEEIPVRETDNFEIRR